MKINEFFLLIIPVTHPQVNFIFPYMTEVKDTEIHIFCFCFAGEDGERNGRCYGFSVQCQNQSGGHHGAFCKGKVSLALEMQLLEIHSTNHVQKIPNCDMFIFFSGSFKVIALKF